jgi:hypothetical protein
MAGIFGVQIEIYILYFYSLWSCFGKRRRPNLTAQMILPG